MYLEKNNAPALFRNVHNANTIIASNLEFYDLWLERNVHFVTKMNQARKLF